MHDAAVIDADAAVCGGAFATSGGGGGGGGGGGAGTGRPGTGAAVPKSLEIR